MQHGWSHPQGLTLADLAEGATQRILDASNSGNRALLTSQPALYDQLVSAATEAAPLRPGQYQDVPFRPSMGSGDADSAVKSASSSVMDSGSVVSPEHHHVHHPSVVPASSNASAGLFSPSPVDELHRQQRLLCAHHQNIYVQATDLLHRTCQAFSGEPILGAHCKALEADLAASHAAASEYLAQQVAHGTEKLKEHLVPFRKKRDHPKQAKKILEAWYQANEDSLGRAYCSKADRARLAQDCDLKPKQVSTWVSNRRNRHGKDEAEGDLGENEA